MTCLLARAARALKYPRRLERGGGRERERFLRVQSRHRVGAVDVQNVLNVRWWGKTEATRPGGTRGGRDHPHFNEPRPGPGGVGVAARPVGLTAGDEQPGE